MNKFFSGKDTIDRKTQDKLRVLFALLALGGKSDRAISKILGVSNTTLSRRRRKLEQEGYIKEYTLIPNLHKMGLEVIVFSFSSTSEVVTPTQSKEAQELIRKYPEVLCVLEDQGLSGTNWVGITVHKNYDGFIELTQKVQKDLLALHPQPHIETHTMMFHTGRLFPKPFSLQNLEALFQPIKPPSRVGKKRSDKKIIPIHI